MTPLFWALIGHTILWAIWAITAEIISYKKGVNEGGRKKIGWGNRLFYYISVEFQLLLILSATLKLILRKMAEKRD